MKKYSLILMALLVFGAMQTSVWAQCNVNFQNSSLGSYPGGFSFRNTVDFNGDGLTDFSAQSGNSIMILERLPDGGLAAPITLNVPSPNFGSIYLHSWGDFNGDGRPDLLVQYTTNAPAGAIWLNNGNNGLVFGTMMPFAMYENINNVADLNGDGISDIVTIDFNRPIGVDENSWYVYLSNGISSFAPRQLLHLNNGNSLVGDFDGDKKMDVALFHVTNKVDKRGIRMFTNFAGTGFRDNGEIKLSNVYVYIATDLTGDGKADFFASTGTQGVLLRTDSPSKLTQITYPMNFPGNNRYFVGDFNGDGRRDLLQTGVSFQGVSGFTLFAGQANGIPVATSGNYAFDNYSDVIWSFATDYDFDGKTDIIKFTTDRFTGMTQMDFVKNICQ